MFCLQYWFLSIIPVVCSGVKVVSVVVDYPMAEHS